MRLYWIYAEPMRGKGYKPAMTYGSLPVEHAVLVCSTTGTEVPQARITACVAGVEYSLTGWLATEVARQAHDRLSHLVCTGESNIFMDDIVTWAMKVVAARGAAKHEGDHHEDDV